MVNVVESNNRDAPPRRAVDVYPELIAEIDRRIESHSTLSERNLRNALYKAVAALWIPMLGMVFYLGQLSQDFTVALVAINSQDVELSKRANWSARKDALDDDMIRYLMAKGYQPPPWYRGLDYEETSK